MGHYHWQTLAEVTVYITHFKYSDSTTRIKINSIHNLELSYDRRLGKISQMIDSTLATLAILATYVNLN